MKLANWIPTVQDQPNWGKLVEKIMNFDKHLVASDEEVDVN